MTRWAKSESDTPSTAEKDVARARWECFGSENSSRHSTSTQVKVLFKKYRYPVKSVIPMFVKKSLVFKRNGDFEGGEEREATNTATPPTHQWSGGWDCLEGWEVVVWEGEEGWEVELIHPGRYG